jgi:hypothetical protein
MAVEMNPAPKQLLKHTVPLLLIMALLTGVFILAWNGRSQTELTEGNAAARDLVSRVLEVKPSANGLAEVTLNHPTAAGASLQNGVAQAGQVTQFLLDLQAPVASN